MMAMLCSSFFASAKAAPPIPTGVTATAGYKQITISWNASPGATGYQVLRNGNGSNSYNGIGQATGTSYTDTGLNNGQTYYYVVRSYSNINDKSNNSAQVSAAPSLAAPLNLSAASGAHQITLYWNTVPNATNYRIWGKTGAVPYVILGTTGLLGLTSYTHAGLASGTTYDYAVQAGVVNTGEWSPLFSYISATTIAPPGVPTGFTGVPGNAQAQLFWNAVPTATSYNLWRTSPTQSWAVIASPIPGTTYLDTGLTNDVDYLYTLTATNDAGTSGFVPNITVRPTAPVVLSSLSISPTTVAGGASTTGTVTLSKAAPTGGAVVALSDNSASATVPSSITVPAGSVSANFTITTQNVTTATPVTVTASYAGVSKTATFTINPTAVLSSLTLNPTSVLGGSSSTGTVTLTSAPTANVTVALYNSNTGAAQVPSSVTVPAGQTTATFTVTTYPVNPTITATISATYAGVTKTALLTINAPVLQGFSFYPSASSVSVYGGDTVNLIVSLTGTAPGLGASVSLSSNTTAVTVPTSVVVGPGTTSTVFTVTTNPVSVVTVATMTATYNGVSKTLSLTVKPPSLYHTCLSRRFR